MNPDLHKPETNGRNRRSFIQKTAAAAATVAVTGIIKTPVYGQNQAPSTGRVIGANDRIVVAYVGTGSQGKEHIRNQKKHATGNNIVQAAVCDVYQKRLDEAKALAGLADADAYRDHQALLERKDIDAVIVSTVDQWHCDVACDALEAGKHVYGEKPFARYLDEGFRIHDTAKRTGKVFVIGSQYCGDRKYHQAAEWIRAGMLGPLVWAQGSYCRNNPKNSEWTYPIDPDANENNLDWNRWLGRTLKIPFAPERYFSWHKFYAYNSGILGNLLAHTFLPLLLATGNPEFPRRVTCTGTRKISTDREVTDTTHLLAEMPSGLTICVAGSTVNEVGLPEMIRGRQGTLYFASGQDQVALKPERPFAEEIEPQDFHSATASGDLALLEKNFFDCIRSGATPVAGVDLAIRAHTILCLAEMSERLGLMLHFDGQTRTIKTGDGKVIKPIDYDIHAPCPLNRRLVLRARQIPLKSPGAPALQALMAILMLPAALAHGAEADDDGGKLPLRDFKPQSMLRVNETKVDHARFPVIDVHNHVNDAGALSRPHPSAADVVARMDRCNVQRVVILTGGWGQSLQRVLDTMAKPYPDRFTVFCQLDWSKVAEPDFSDQMLALLRDSVKRGARGLKIMKEFGLRYRDASGKLLAVNDPRLDPIWAECGRLGIPVAIHVGDPAAFFSPIDARNERYEELQAHLDWSFFGADFPSLNDILQAVERVFARHPATSFIWLHVGNWPENLDYIGGVLNRRPNVVAEIGARQADLGRVPRRARQFLVEFQDRILFGLDVTLTADAYRSYFRWLETEDEYFDYYNAPAQGRWKIYGLGLPDAVLEKVYHQNAERILSQFKNEPKLKQ